MRSVSVRPAAPSDLEALRDVYRQASLSNDSDRDLLTRHPELLEWPAAALGEGRTRVATSGEAVVGFATLGRRRDDAMTELEDLFVAPGWSRRGVGRKLVEDCLAVARAQGRAGIEVDANPAALGFYERVGFVAVGDAVLEYGTGVRMRLEIGRE